MRFLLVLVVLIVINCHRLEAQCQVPNGDFEELVDITDTLSKELTLILKFPVVAPVGWLPTFRTVEIALSDFFADYLDRDTMDLDIFAGLRPVNPGAAGTTTAVRLQGDTLALSSDMVQFFPCSARPEKITGFHRYVGSAPRDSLIVMALLTSNQSLNQEDAIGSAVFITYGGPNEYTPFEASFEYVSDEIPDTAAVLILSLKDEEHAGDTSHYVVDQIQFEGESVPVREITWQQRPFLTPNPITDRAALSVRTEEPGLLQIYDALGRPYYQSQVVNGNSVHLNHLPTGFYLARFETRDQSLVQKILKL